MSQSVRLGKRRGGVGGRGGGGGGGGLDCGAEGHGHSKGSNCH